MLCTNTLNDRRHVSLAHLIEHSLEKLTFMNEEQLRILYQEKGGKPRRTTKLPLNASIIERRRQVRNGLSLN